MNQVCTYGKHVPKRGHDVPKRGHDVPKRGHFATNAILKTDPTRTTMLRAKFVADVERRFRKLKADIRTSIIKNDCFGIQPEVIALSPVHPKAYEFKRTANKIEAFMLWLEEQEAAGILEIIRRPGGLRGMYEAWSDTYIHSAYAKGIRRGRSELRHAGYDVTSIDVVRGGVASIMNQPFHADRLAVLYTRTFDDLKSVTQVMNASVRRQIADGLTTGLTRGMAEGKSPRVIARQLYKDVANHVDKIGRVRCRMIARTEIVRAHHLATIQEYRQADADMDVGVKAEFSTAGFNVCPLCIDLENGGPYSLDMIEGMIPVHPNCSTAETTVLAPDKIAGFVATYTGSIIKLRFASGRRLSVTPNHMLLAPHGFTFAKSFSKGDHVLSCPDFERIIIVDPDDDGNPARIDNIVKAFAESSRMSAHRVPTAAKYLHGDGKFCQGNIDIVGTDSFLRDDPNAIRAEQMNKLGFETSGRFANLDSFSAFTQFLKATALAADSSMGRFREAFATDRAFALHSDDISLTRTTERKSSGKEYSVNWRSTAPVALRQCQNRFAGLIELDEVIDVEVESVSHLKVYDLQCESTMYIANGILSSNCRCVALPVVVEKPYHVAAGPRTPIGRGISIVPISRVKPTVPFVPQAPVARAVPQPGAPYKTLKTIEECEAWATTNAGARNVYYQQIPELKVKGMGSKMTKAEALIHFNRVNKAIDDYMRQQRIRMPETDVFYITKTNRARAARGWTKEKGNIYGISFSPDWTDDNWAKIAAWEKRTGKKWDWIREKDGYATTLRHEYSHIMDYQHGITRSPEFTRMVLQLRKDYNFYAADISQYASTNVREYFAEAMSHYTSPLYGTERPKFPKILEDFLESILDKYREVK